VFALKPEAFGLTAQLARGSLIWRFGDWDRLLPCKRRS